MRTRVSLTEGIGGREPHLSGWGLTCVGGVSPEWPKSSSSSSLATDILNLSLLSSTKITASTSLHTGRGRGGQWLTISLIAAC